MKIGFNVHFFDEYISGVEYYSLGLINSLLQVDEKNQYVLFTNRPTLATRHLSKSTNLLIQAVPYVWNRMQRIAWDNLRLPYWVRASELDILHCTHYILPLFKVSIPKIVTIHDTIAIDHPQWCKPTNALHYKMLMKRSVDKARRIIAVSKTTADDLRRLFCLEETRLSVVHPGIDEIFRKPAAVAGFEKVKAHYSLPGRYILFVGNVEPKKNTAAVLAVHKILRENRFPHKLVIAGKRSWRCGRELSAIRKLAANNQVLHLGYVDREDLPFIYKMADVFVFPSLYEGFGFPVLEAMACGTPVVTSDRGALPEITGQAALIVKPENVRQISSAVMALINNYQLRQKYIQRGFEQSRLFDWRQTARQMLCIYEQVATGRKNMVSDVQPVLHGCS